MRESHVCGLKTSILRINDNFSPLTNKSRKNCSLIFDFLKNIPERQFESVMTLCHPAKSKHAKVVAFQIALKQCSKDVGTSSEDFGKVQKASENWRKSSGVAGTFLNDDPSKAKISQKKKKKLARIWLFISRKKGIRFIISRKFRQSMSLFIYVSEMEGDDRLWTSNAAPVSCVTVLK